MFTKMKNIDTAFRHMRLFNVLLLCACTITMCFLIWRSNETLKANRGKVYVMVNGQLVEAVSKDQEYSAGNSGSYYKVP